MIKEREEAERAHTYYSLSLSPSFLNSKNADISYTAGSVKTGMSAVELSGTTAATTATFRIMGFSSDPDNSTTGSANVNVIVKFNEHFYVDPTGV